MLTRDDLIDLIMEGLRLAASPVPAPGPVSAGTQSSNPWPVGQGRFAKEETVRTRGRLFLSEYDIKKRLAPSAQLLTIPKDAIISPLATDWLVLKGVKIVRQ